MGIIPNVYEKNTWPFIFIQLNGEHKHDLEATHNRYASQERKQPVETIFKPISQSHNVHGNTTISYRIEPYNRPWVSSRDA